jgi:hypothetical protein
MTFSAENMSEHLLGALPSANALWEEHLAWWGDKERGHFNDMSEFARHIVECCERGQTEEFAAAFALIERFITEGPDEVRELAVVGLLESVQNIASNTIGGYEAFDPWLGPYSMAGWREIERLWAGESSLMDVVRTQRRE